MKDNCCCWRVDQRGVVRNSAVTSGLWSVSSRKRRPSSKNRKWRTVLKAASSFPVECGIPGATPTAFLRKKRVADSSPASCCRTPRTWVSEASVSRESTAFGAGCVSGAVAASAPLAAWKAAAGGHTSVLESPQRESVRGSKVRVIPGRKRL